MLGQGLAKKPICYSCLLKGVLVSLSTQQTDRRHSRRRRTWDVAIITATVGALSLSIAAPAHADADLTSDPGDTNVKRIPMDQIPYVTTEDLPNDGIIYDDVDATTLQDSSSFHIFFSPNCAGGRPGSANRYYPGLNSGEAWINDRFDDATAGAAGYGQLIRQNAASISVSNATVWISADGGYSFSAFSSRGFTCFNLGDRGLRNRNTNWITRPAL